MQIVLVLRAVGWTHRSSDENPLRRLGPSSAGNYTGSAQFRQNPVWDFEKRAAERFGYAAEADASEATSRVGLNSEVAFRTMDRCACQHDNFNQCGGHTSCPGLGENVETALPIKPILFASPVQEVLEDQLHDDRGHSSR